MNDYMSVGGDDEEGTVDSNADDGDQEEESNEMSS